MPPKASHSNRLLMPHNHTVSHFASQLQHAAPQWQPHHCILPSLLPAQFRDWLLDTASLTRRIVHACDGQFRVQLLDQAWRRPMLNEGQALGMRYARNALVRQVYLLCNEIPWVYARTVIPRNTLSGANRRLAHLKSRSLGATLFADPSMRRGEVEICRLRPTHALFAMATRALSSMPEEIWGRRSVFYLHAKPLLVSEFFLPAVAEHGL